MSTFLPENRGIYFAYLPEFVGPLAKIQKMSHAEQLYLYNADSTVITLGFNPESALIYFMDGPDGADSVSIITTVTAGHPAVELTWDVSSSPSGRLVQYEVFEVVT